MDLGYMGAIFDLDGTLLDSMGVWTAVDHAFLAHYGLPLDREYLMEVKRHSHAQAAVYTKEYFGLSDSPEDIVSLWHELAGDAYQTTIGLKPGVYEYLNYLHDSGVKIAAATSSLPEHAPTALERLGIMHFFENITYTREAARPSKTFPDVYLLAAERLGLSAADCIVFEDIPIGIAAAREGGFRVVAVDEPFYADESCDFAAYAVRTITDFRDLIGVAL